ncbi:hypothetical protein [Olleya marilimosa]|uniref:hypothetical protein n=1 Tax=Olleya marilimosa TaxID=272164 RepID=UPI00168D2D8B|nr:hypothetical protein [Olleya marilimosa]MBD3892227.1 hypothetical protein [Olleya marilimosa]
MIKRVSIFIASFLLLFGCINNSKLEKFDKEKWQSATQIERGNMSTDLVESKILIGKSKSKIIEYLGYPKDSTKTNFHYLVDFGYMNPFNLDVNFDSTGLKAKKVTLTD